MLLIHCPYCEQDRPESEFSHAGEAHITRPTNPETVSDVEWEAFLYLRDNLKGEHAERWRHTHGCGQYFNAIRDTLTDHFSATYKAGQPRPRVNTPTRNGGGQ
jgi:sarcosine oxidase, subunit delta